MVITMSVKSIMQNILHISILKTIYINIKCFGLKGLRMPILISRRCRIKIIGNIVIPRYTFGLVKMGFGGSPAVIENRYSRFSVAPKSTIIFKGKIGVSAGSSICVDNGTLTIGDGFSTNKNCFIACSKGITIGDNVTLGWNVNIRDNDGHRIIERSSGKISESKEVQIGDHVWLCSYVNVLKGVSIPNESVVAYGSLVTTKFDKDNVLLGGTPAKILKDNISWEY